MSEEVKQIKIKGNDYVMVHERMKEFHRLYKNGSISTELIEMTDRFITKTTVIPDVKNPERYFTGIAYEKEDASFINKTSALENCETSSVGRALGWLNIGIDTSIASYDEVINAIEQQKKPEIQKAPKLRDINITNPKAKENVKKYEDDILFKDNQKEAEKKVDDGGLYVEDDGDWDGSEVIKFGKYKNNSGDPSNDITWAKLVDAAWMEWVAKSSKVDWQREKAQKELNRRGAISG